MSATMRQVAMASLALASLFYAARDAAAFCQATSCDPAVALCKLNAEGCMTTGVPLSWVSNCLTVSVQGDGSPKQHIDFAAAQASVTRAFGAWTSALCQGGVAPSITVNVDSAPITCDASEYNPERGNANIVVFREDAWPYPGGQDALGLTRIRFDPETGEIWDSDIELNSVDAPLSVGEPSANFVDLDSLLTHEAGHLLGLAHNTRDKTATMFPGYQPGSIDLRSLESDDISGICALYPPTRQARATTCEPRHGFSALCGADQPAPALEHSAAEPGGCSTVASPARPRLGWIIASVAALGALALRRPQRRS
jgi:hypothetical protein